MTVSDCKRQGADQPSTRAGWSVPLLFTTMSVLKHFVDVHYYIVSIFVRFLLYVVYEFVLCSPYLEDNKVSIYLLCRTSTNSRQGGFMVCDLMSGASKGLSGSGSGTTPAHDLYKDRLQNFKFDFRN